MKKPQLISEEIEDFYNQTSEENRLDMGLGQLEFERVKELIEKYIPNPNSSILDVGGGTGKYSEWLAKKDHHVTLIEPIQKHIKLAQKRADKFKSNFNVQHGEASSLDIPANFADLVILHGPLYHLQERKDRDQALNETKRVLKEGGIVLGFAINYAASSLVGLLQGLIHNKSFFEMCKSELGSGIHNPAKDFPWLLAEAYYHKPENLRTEFLEQGFEYINTYAVEGMVWLDKEYFTSRSDTEKWKVLKELLEITQNDSNLLSFSPHMMIAARKTK